MITLAPYYDTAVLVSGDGDLAYAVNAVSRMGVRVEVVSLQTTTSESLIDVADCFIDLDSIKAHIQKILILAIAIAHRQIQTFNPPW